MAETRVRVRLVQDTETRKVAIEVAVLSNVKPHLWCHGLVDADNSNLSKLVQQKAEQAATWQCQKHGDMHDPRQCGLKAVEALGDIQRRAERATTRDKAGTSSDDQAFQGNARDATGVEK